LLLRRLECPFRLPLLGGIKKGHIHDRQMRRFRPFPFLWRIGSRDAAACIWILDHLDSIPDDPSGIKFIQDYAMVAFFVAVDGRCGPIATARWSNPLLIQSKSDFPRRLASDIADEDLMNDLRLFLDDFKFTGLADHRSVTVSSTACVTTIANDTLHAAPNFVSKVRQKEGAQETPDANLNLIRRTFMDGAQFDTEEIKALPNPCQVFLIAGQPIQRFDENDLKLAVPCAIEQAL
jgi:hypothetical protein